MKIRFTPQAQKKPDHIKGMRVPYAQGKRKVPLAARWRWYLVVLVVTSPLLYLLGKIAISYILITAPGVLSLEKISINSTATGIVEQLAAPVGAEMAEGEVIARLGNKQLEGRRLVVERELAALKKQYSCKIADQKNEQEQERLRQKEYQQELTRAEKQQRLARQMLGYQKAHLDKVIFLQSQGAATIAELRQAEAGYDAALYRADNAENAVNQKKVKIELEQKKLELMQQKKQIFPAIDKAEAELAAIGRQQQGLVQKAPYRGRVLEHIIKEGQAVSPGTPLMLIARRDNPVIVCYLKPKYAGYAKAGHYARVSFADGKNIKARVVSDARLVKRLPADLATPMGMRNLLMLVSLTPLEPLADDLRVDGLPVTVRFRRNWMTFLQDFF
ncbi:MAG: hypothetical protein CSB24_06695 [Deltaproteobacteria bacterium]|nr:MAG: hypothetical protein CSB24_06695 [Deltaproteobacteria bacterium]